MELAWAADGFGLGRVALTIFFSTVASSKALASS
jgi:hypothetical protein